jgi:hypothetical protein
MVLFIPKMVMYLYGGGWQGGIFPGEISRSLNLKSLQKRLPGHAEGAARLKNVINTRKNKILHFAQNDKIA